MAALVPLPALSLQESFAFVLELVPWCSFSFLDMFCLSFGGGIVGHASLPGLWFPKVLKAASSTFSTLCPCRTLESDAEISPVRMHHGRPADSLLV